MALPTDEKTLLAIHHISQGDADPHEQSTETLKHPMGSVAEIRHQEIHI